MRNPGITFRPGQNGGEGRIDGEEADVDVGIVLPVPQQEVGLGGLSSDVTQARRDDGHSARMRWAEFCCPLIPMFFRAFAAGGYVEIRIALADAIEAEVLLCEFECVVSHAFAKVGVRDSFATAPAKAGSSPG